MLPVPCRVDPPLLPVCRSARFRRPLQIISLLAAAHAEFHTMETRAMCPPRISAHPVSRTPRMSGDAMMCAAPEQKHTSWERPRHRLHSCRSRVGATQEAARLSMKLGIEKRPSKGEHRKKGKGHGASQERMRLGGEKDEHKILCWPLREKNGNDRVVLWKGGQGLRPMRRWTHLLAR